MQDPRKVRLLECIGINPWKEQPKGWVAPTEDECTKIKLVLGEEADAREKEIQSK